MTHQVVDFLEVMPRKTSGKSTGLKKAALKVRHVTNTSSVRGQVMSIHSSTLVSSLRPVPG